MEPTGNSVCFRNERAIIIFREMRVYFFVCENREAFFVYWRNCGHVEMVLRAST